MSSSAHSQSQPHSVARYITIWAAILVLFVISITVAQVSDNRLLVLITAFGIATVQAFLVAAYFMHLSEERAYISYLLISMLLALVMFYAGSMSDEKHPAGLNWVAADASRIIKEHQEKPATNAQEQAVKNAVENKTP